MASCSKCGKNVGCACSLIDGSCHKCYSGTMHMSPSALKPKRLAKAKVAYSEPEAKPLTDFQVILRTPNISQEEKLRRINDILEKARQKI